MGKFTHLHEDIKRFFKGNIEVDRHARGLYSHDASLFEIKPEAIAYPRDVTDICNLVEHVSKNKLSHPDLSLTGRSGGTDMSGGAINESIIVAYGRYFTQVGQIKDNEVTVQPGVYYRDFEPKTLEQGLIMPSYPASKDLCMIGGMVANNAGGEKSLIYGKTDRYVKQVKIVLRDGKEHTFQAIDKKTLKQKLNETGLEGDLYRGIYKLVTENQEIIKASKPKVSKNSTAYNIWDVWDGEAFDMTKIIVGSQGTLGLITEATFRLVPAKPLSGMVVIFLKNLDGLAAYDFLVGQKKIDSRRIGIIGSSVGAVLAANLVTNRGIKSLILKAPAAYTDYMLNLGMAKIMEREAAWFSEIPDVAATPTGHSIAGFKGSMLIVPSEYDHVIPPTITDGLFEVAVHAGRKNLTTIQGADHSLSDPVWKQEFRDIATQWFRETLDLAE